MIVKKGQWYTQCCYLDFCQAEEDKEFDDKLSGLKVWDTEIEGLVEFLEEEIYSSYSPIPIDKEVIEKIKQRIIDLVNKN